VQQLMLAAVWPQLCIDMVLSTAAWVVSAVAMKQCNFEYVCRVRMWVVLSAEEYLHKYRRIMDQLKILSIY
jgi:hypothetical protein